MVSFFLFEIRRRNRYTSALYDGFSLMSSPDFLLSSYDYLLPESCIAQGPAHPAHNAKMMVAIPDKQGDFELQDQHFLDLAAQLDENYLLFLNSTKVFKARIPLHNTKIIRKSGKEVLLASGEIFIYQLRSESQFECLVSDSKNFKPWSQIFFEEGIVFKSLAFTENGLLFEIIDLKRTDGKAQLFDFLEKRGEMPLPPYIRYEKAKEQRYQTFFAEKVGSAAAPTASLHFTPELVRRLENKKVWFQYCCLHVGLGTFKPVYEENIADQKLHFESMLIEPQLRKLIADAKQAGKIFLPVGTTMIRYLESLPYIWRFLKKKNLISSLDPATQARRNDLSSPISEELIAEFIPETYSNVSDSAILAPGWYLIQTRLFIRPWIPFYLTDELITNFHLPKSSLMMLISAFMGRKNLLKCYQEAIWKGYQFYSFWDGMRVRRKA